VFPLALYSDEKWLDIHNLYCCLLSFLISSIYILLVLLSFLVQIVWANLAADLNVCNGRLFWLHSAVFLFVVQYGSFVTTHTFFLGFNCCECRDHFRHIGHLPVQSGRYCPGRMLGDLYGFYRLFNLKVDRILIRVIYLLRFAACYITQLTCIYSKCWKWCPFISVHLSTRFTMFLTTFLSVLLFTSSMAQIIFFFKILNFSKNLCLQWA
jgi:hypothetical protein